MKKILSILTVAGLIATTINVSAQKGEQKFKLGAKAGLNLANIKETGTGAGSFKSITGFIVGGFAAIPVSSSFAIQPELLYGQYGAKSDALGISIDLKTSYLSVPLLAKYSFKETGFSLLAGPQIGVLLSAKTLGVDVKSSFQGSDVSGVFGAEYELKNGLSIAARYQLGVSNIEKSTVGSDTKAKNNAFQFTVGYAFLK